MRAGARASGLGRYIVIDMIQYVRNGTRVRARMSLAVSSALVAVYRFVPYGFVHCAGYRHFVEGSSLRTCERVERLGGHVPALSRAWRVRLPRRCLALYQSLEHLDECDGLRRVEPRNRAWLPACWACPACVPCPVPPKGGNTDTPRLRAQGTVRHGQARSLKTTHRTPLRKHRWPRSMVAECPRHATRRLGRLHD